MNYLQKTKASSLAKLAKLPVYQHPADLLNEKHLPFNNQRKQINGLLPFTTQNYTSIYHCNLMQSLVKTRQSYTKALKKQKQQIALGQYLQWVKYANNLKESMKQDKKLTQQHKQNLYEAFLNVKERNQQKLALNRMLNLMNQYSKTFKISFTIHPLILAKMIHPHFGYLNLYKNKLKLDETFDFLQEMISASLIRYDGNSLHSSQLLAFYFWKLYLKNTSIQNQSFMEINQFLSMLKMFKFQVADQQSFKNKFKYTIDQTKGQFNETNIVRFDFFRRLFLDYDL